MTAGRNSAIKASQHRLYLQRAATLQVSVPVFENHVLPEFSTGAPQVFAIILGMPARATVAHLKWDRTAQTRLPMSLSRQKAEIENAKKPSIDEYAKTVHGLCRRARCTKKRSAKNSDTAVAVLIAFTAV